MQWLEGVSRGGGVERRRLKREDVENTNTLCGNRPFEGEGSVI